MNPFDIPKGYDPTKHRALRCTIQEDPHKLQEGLRLMSCHEYPVGAEKPCVGWLVNQLDRNNLGLRLAVIRGRVDANVKVVGPQHETFEDTLPMERP